MTHKNSLDNTTLNLHDNIITMGNSFLKSNRIYDYLAVVFIVLFFIIFSLISLHRFWQFESWYYDFGIFDQAIYSVSQFRAPIIDHFVLSDHIIFADHFSPFIFLLSPGYWLTQKSEFILIIQALFVSLSGIFIYQLAKNKLNSFKFGFLFMLIYLSFIGLHNALITEFHEITLLPLPLSLFFISLENKNRKLFFISTLAILLVKESTFVIPFFFCFFAWWKEKNRVWKRTFLITSIICLIYGFVIIKFVIPSYGPGFSYLPEKFNWQIIISIFQKRKMQTVIETLASFSFLPLLAPSTLPPILVNWFTRFISGGRSDLGMHYNAEIAPTLIYGSILGYSNFKRWIQKRKIIGKKIKEILLYLPFLMTIWAIFFSLYCLKSPILLGFNKDFYRHTKNFKFLNELINAVPKDEKVIMAQHNLATRFTHRKVYILRDNYDHYDPFYIIIDKRDGQNPNNFLGITNKELLFEKLDKDNNYYLLYDQGEQKIYAKYK